MSPASIRWPTERAQAYEPVTDAQSIRLTLVELMAGGHPLCLMPRGACDRPRENLSLEVAETSLFLSHPSEAWPEPDEFHEAVITAELRGARLRFEALAPQRTVRGGRAALRLDWPQRLLRLQERDAYRVQPCERPGAHCVVRTAPGEERWHAVIDISALGVSMIWPDSAPAPRVDELWRHCRLEIGDRAPIPCDLRVRAVSRLEAISGQRLKVGCEFDHPTPETQRAAQIFVLETERSALNARGKPIRA